MVISMSSSQDSYTLLNLKFSFCLYSYFALYFWYKITMRTQQKNLNLQTTIYNTIFLLKYQKKELKRQIIFYLLLKYQKKEMKKQIVFLNRLILYNWVFLDESLSLYEKANHLLIQINTV